MFNLARKPYAESLTHWKQPCDVDMGGQCLCYVHADVTFDLTHYMVMKLVVIVVDCCRHCPLSAFGVPRLWKCRLAMGLDNAHCSKNLIVLPYK